MSPNTAIAASQLRQLIFYHLDNELSDNATFLAGRLYALEPRNPDSSHLLALTNLRQRRWKLAYDSAHKYGSGGRHLGCAYIFAQACLELGKYLEEQTLGDVKTTHTRRGSRADTPCEALAELRGHEEGWRLLR
jgi:anaphase-promoting complex subunit 3